MKDSGDLKETEYLPESSVNAERLAEAIDEIEAMIAQQKLNLS